MFQPIGVIVEQATVLLEKVEEEASLTSPAEEAGLEDVSGLTGAEIRQRKNEGRYAKPVPEPKFGQPDVRLIK